MNALALPTFWVTCNCGERTPPLDLAFEPIDEEKYSFQKFVKCKCGANIPVLLEIEVEFKEGKSKVKKFNARTI